MHSAKENTKPTERKTTKKRKARTILDPFRIKRRREEGERNRKEEEANTERKEPTPQVEDGKKTRAVT